jgi:hypothetical protein
VKRYTIEQFLDTAAINGGFFSHDDKPMLCASDASGLFNAHTVPVTGSLATQITHSTEDNVFPVSFFPKDNRILYHGDKGGNEIFHVFLRDEDGAVKDLTPGDKNRALFHGWVYDEKSFYYQSKSATRVSWTPGPHLSSRPVGLGPVRVLAATEMGHITQVKRRLSLCASQYEPEVMPGPTGLHRCAVGWPLALARDQRGASRRQFSRIRPSGGESIAREPQQLRARVRVYLRVFSKSRVQHEFPGRAGRGREKPPQLD